MVFLFVILPIHEHGSFNFQNFFSPGFMLRAYAKLYLKICRWVTELGPYPGCSPLQWTEVCLRSLIHILVFLRYMYPYIITISLSTVLFLDNGIFPSSYVLVIALGTAKNDLCLYVSEFMSLCLWVETKKWTRWDTWEFLLKWADSTLFSTDTGQMRFPKKHCKNSFSEVHSFHHWWFSFENNRNNNNNNDCLASSLVWDENSGILVDIPL